MHLMDGDDVVTIRAMRLAPDADRAFLSSLNIDPDSWSVRDA